MPEVVLDGCVRVAWLQGSRFEVGPAGADLEVGRCGLAVLRESTWNWERGIW